MATGPEAVRAIAAATGIPVGTVDRFAKVLKQHKPAPLWARSIPGNGAQSEHVDALRLSNLLLGFAGDQPSDAAEAAIKLSAFEFYATSEDMAPRLPGSLGDVIEHIIQQTAEVADASVLCLPDLLLSVNPPWAELHWPSVADASAYVETYKPGVGKLYTVAPWVFSRQVRIGWEMLAAMGKLLADTTQQKTTPDSKTAAEAPPSRGRQPRITQTAREQPKPLNKAKDTRTLTSASKPSVRSDLLAVSTGR